MAFLQRQGKYANACTPDLILLDLNMPRMDGREVLEALSRDDRFKHLPVVVLTSSEADRDVVGAYRLQCRSYIVKPVDFAGFAKAIQELANYWFTLVVLPSEATEKEAGRELRPAGAEEAARR